MIHRGEKGFTLIELLVVIAILGVIAAVVALSVAGFFGRGTLQAANTELHQAQTAIIAAMADAETNVVIGEGETFSIYWAGEDERVLIQGADGDICAAAYIYGPFRAVYEVDETGAIVFGWCYDYDFTDNLCPDNLPQNPWGPTIIWDEDYMSWRAVEDGEYD